MLVSGDMRRILTALRIGASGLRNSCASSATNSLCLSASSSVSSAFSLLISMVNTSLILGIQGMAPSSTHNGVGHRVATQDVFAGRIPRRFIAHTSSFRDTGGLRQTALPRSEKLETRQAIANEPGFYTRAQSGT